MHENYYEISANSYFELGFQAGQLFKKQLQTGIEHARQSTNFVAAQVKSQENLAVCRHEFPQLVEEAEGYAQGAEEKFSDYWALHFFEHLTRIQRDPIDKCTTLITNTGLLIGHNEDWEPNTADRICVLKRKIKDLTTLELFYYNTWGGNSISVNSHGYVQTINTLTSTDAGDSGIPRNIVARWLSETSNPTNDFQRLQTLPRPVGYCHNFLNSNGDNWTIEVSAEKASLNKINPPFVHTNHFLGELKSLEANSNNTGTLTRFQTATTMLDPKETNSSVQTILMDQGQGPITSLHNERTIASIVINLSEKEAIIWLAREPNLGWLTYPLDFLP